MSIFFSPSALAFYDDALKVDYEASGSWPQDAVRITESKYEELLNGQSEGKIIALNDNGDPVLISPPPPTTEEIIASAELQKSELMETANKAITPLQDAVDLGMSTDEENELLLEWKKYRVLLNRVDTSTAPAIEWPEPPITD